MVTYRQRVREIEHRLKGRLIYFGTRGTDSRPLLEITNFEEVFSQIAPLAAVSIQETCLETLKGERVDLDRYSIDQDTSEGVRAVRKGLLKAFSGPATAVVPYRPCAVLTSACFARGDHVNYLGVFHEKQACFEHKPWVETQLAKKKVRVLPWSYFADDDLILIREAAEAGPLVLRANRSDGGAGLTLVRDPSQIQDYWPLHLDGFLAAAPFLEPSIPLNVNACVFPGGSVTMHPPSLQLVGIPACTNRKFGYCGNDFARIADLDRRYLEELEKLTIEVGQWLQQQGYLGAFGVDALVHEGMVYMVEVNPRFQGSSLLSALLMRDLDLPDLFLDHISAFLGISPTPKTSLYDLARNQPHAAHVISHNLANYSVRASQIDPESLLVRCSLIPQPTIAIQPEGITFEATFYEPITNTGFELLPKIEHHLQSVQSEAFQEQIILPFLESPDS